MPHSRALPALPTHKRRNLRREWLLLSLFLLLAVTWLHSTQALQRMDHWINDLGLRWSAPPASADIAIIAIDDASIAAIGRWPWRRALHAQLLRQISAQQPQAIGLDILFGEADADYPGDDLLLAQAIQQAQPVVLPIARRSQAGNAVDAPLPLLAQAARQFGHVQAEVDSDGSARSIFMREGMPPLLWPHFSQAMRCAAGQPSPDCQERRTPEPSGHGGSSEWQREHAQIIHFARTNPGFAQYSYIDVLKGQLPAQALQHKYVLVGATATGLGDMFSSPVQAPGARIPGVELIAHALNAELTGHYLQPAPAHWALGWQLAAVLLALLGIFFFGPLAGLASTAAVFALCLCWVLLAPALSGWQWPVAPALLTLALTYPLWSWRRLSAAAHFLQLEMQQLSALGLLAQDSAHLAQPPQPASKHQWWQGDLLEQRIDAVEQATGRLRKLHQFISSSLQHLPSPTFVCDSQGLVLLANAAAQDYVPAAPALPLVGQPVAHILADVRSKETQQAVLPSDFSLMASTAQSQAAQDQQGRHLLVFSTPFQPLESQEQLWLISLVDLSAMHQAQRQRDQALHFISHDIRAPIAAIVTLLEMQRNFPNQHPLPSLLARIDTQAQRSLAMAQSFVRLASAQSDEYQFIELDLATLLQEAADDMWAKAKARAIRIHISALPTTAACLGDAQLLRRAIGNLLGNAIQFSPDGAAIDCALQERDGQWLLSIRDQGPGIAAEQQHRLFQPFNRLHQESHPGVDGIGLGLALVHTVAQRHGGRVLLHSQSGQGATFTLVLPQAAAVVLENS